MPHALAKRRNAAAAQRRRNGLLDPVPVIEVARTLRIRYLVALRLVKTGKLRGTHVEDGHYGGRYYVERSEIARARREHPWAPWAMRRCDR